MVDFPPCDDVCGAIEEHVRRFFSQNQVETLTWDEGPLSRVNRHFRVLRVAPQSSRPVDVCVRRRLGGDR